MARDNRIIRRGVRVTTRTEANKPNTARTFVAGQEDELAAVLSQKQLDHYKKKGVITGDWNSTGDTSAGESSEGQSSPEPLIALRPLGLDAVGALIEAGYDTPEAINGASDEALDAVPGIGPATVAKIRELLA